MVLIPRTDVSAKESSERYENIQIGFPRGPNLATAIVPGLFTEETNRPEMSSQCVYEH